MVKKLNIKKIVTTLLIINLLQFSIGLGIWAVAARNILREESRYVYLSIGLMLISSIISILGLYFASRMKSDNLEDSIRDLEEFNTKLRAERHDYLNHFQVIYGLMELKEYEEAKKYIEPIFIDIMKVSKALKTAQPAINALLQAKLEASEKKEIDMFLEIRSDLKNIPIEPWNLCKVLANIIDNSITAVTEIEKEGQIHIEITEDNANYFFRIYNNGPVIPGNMIHDIFKKGFSTKEGQEHGMGLYIASKIIEEAGGTIGVTSDTQRTIFAVSIPKYFELPS